MRLFLKCSVVAIAILLFTPASPARANETTDKIKAKITEFNCKIKQKTCEFKCKKDADCIAKCDEDAKTCTSK